MIGSGEGIRKNQAFWTSVVLHAAVLLGLFLATIVEALRPKEPPHVFEMVASPPERAEAAEAEVAAPPDLEMPEIEPLRPLPDPAPRPRPESPRPEPKPPRPEPSPKKLTYEEFLREHPVADPQPRPPAPRIRFDVPRIDAPRIVIPDRRPGETSEPALSAAQVNQLADYNARLRARLDAAWNKPGELGGVQLAATVFFDVSASGRITNVRLRPPSGNPAFDQSVQAAFARVGTAGPTPTGRGHTFSMTFRMTD